MIETIFVLERARQRQREAPLLRERELFLAHLLQLGCDLKQVRSIASLLLHVIRLLQLQTLRHIYPEEIAAAGQHWANDMPHRQRQVGAISARRFSYVANKWFRFHNVLIGPPRDKKPYDEVVDQFLNAMQTLRDWAPTTLYGYRGRVSKFLEWCYDRDLSLFSISLRDVDRFFAEKRANGWCLRTIRSNCIALRNFFRYAGECGWCKPGIAYGFLVPRAAQPSPVPPGPSWKDVRNLLESTPGGQPSDLRARAILFLCSIYALRSSEIAKLRLEDFDWINETIVVRRAKRGRVQQFPIQYEVGEAILQYLKRGRPQCTCRNIFVSVQIPYRPMLPANISTLVTRRMKKQRILSKKMGAHSLRHAAATELLRKGSSLKNIADFLGHRDLNTVSTYAKYDSRLLRKVSAFSLAGVQ